ncbi:MAG: hypothetical protein K8T90_22415 [Planctomycetes bacterium]|nr:hypothetical protein [Planctomycetota bacterium]
MADAVRWHYITGRMFVPTWQEGVIRTSPDPVLMQRQGIADPPAGYFDCKPVAWFSTADPWEPSMAIKLRRKDGTSEFVRDLAGNARHGGGMYRIGVAAATAPISWTGYRKGGFDMPDVCNRMAKRAKDLNADTRNWWASEVQVPRSLWTRVEVWSDELWKPWSLFGGTAE